MLEFLRTIPHHFMLHSPISSNLHLCTLNYSVCVCSVIGTWVCKNITFSISHIFLSTDGGNSITWTEGFSTSILFTSWVRIILCWEACPGPCMMFSASLASADQMSVSSHFPTPIVPHKKFLQTFSNVPG